MADKYYYESLHIDGIANEEVVETIITSTEEEPAYLDGIAFVEDTAIENHDAVLGLYIEREKIMEMPINQSLVSFNSDLRIGTDPYYPLGHDLPVGQGFKVGHTSGAVASDIYYTLRYKLRD